MQRRGNFSACCRMLHGKPPERPLFHHNRRYKWMFMKDLWEISEREVEDLVQFATEGAFCNTFAAARRTREPLARRMEPASVRRNADRTVLSLVILSLHGGRPRKAAVSRAWSFPFRGLAPARGHGAHRVSQVFQAFFQVCGAGAIVVDNQYLWVGLPVRVLSGLLIGWRKPWTSASRTLLYSVLFASTMAAFFLASLSFRALLKNL